ncbi:unnamed protein product, partial [Mesorhabditis spiculigera]
MTILLFLVDTSASMAQSSYLGLSFLEHARALVANIRKAREQMKGADRFMLVTTEDFPMGIKAGFREGSQIFEQSVNNLRAHGKYHLGQAVLNALQYINTYRAAAADQDRFAEGRWFSMRNDNVVIIVITDTSGATSFPPDFQLSFPARHPAGEFMDEAFRWDQRVFSLVLRLPSTHKPFIPLREMARRLDCFDSPIDNICRQTGGRSWTLHTHEQIPSFVQTFMSVMSISGSMLRFEALISHKNGQMDDRERLALAGKLEKRPLSMIFVRNAGTVASSHWPIPEAFPSSSLAESRTIPPRKAHPVINVPLIPAEPNHTFLEFPFDRYEVEQGPLADYILEFSNRNQQSQLGWLVYVRNSTREGYGKPFGYLKAATNLQVISLFVLPYNYIALFPLLEDLKKTPAIKSNPGWKKSFSKYLDQVPPYYLSNLRKQLRRFNVPPELFEEQCNVPPYNNQIRHLLQGVREMAKRELEQVNIQVQNQNVNMHIAQPKYMPVSIAVEKLTSILPKMERTHDGSWKMCKEEIDEQQKNTIVDPDQKMPDEPRGEPDEKGARLTIREAVISRAKDSMFKNPLTIKRTELVPSLATLYENFRQSTADQQFSFLQGGKPGSILRLQSAAEIHDQPVTSMGLYEEYIRLLASSGMRPREIEGNSTGVGFGNPFAKKNLGSFGVDEVMEGPNTGQKDGAAPGMRRGEKGRGGAQMRRHRKAGPLPWNALKGWRERRKSISERSSIASDFSDISELDSEMEASNGSDLNGKTMEDDVAAPPRINGKRHSDDTPDGPSSPPKKLRLEPRLSTGSNAEQPAKPEVTRLDGAEMRMAQLSITDLVRRFTGRCTTKAAVAHVLKLAKVDLDLYRLFHYAAREADRFKLVLLAEAFRVQGDRLGKTIIAAPSSST